ncbi:MAG: gamma-glutamyl-gamma-aminobutyrate hydrolase family protein [Solirubrobacteraceae bacterium]
MSRLRPAIGICTAVAGASYGVWNQPTAILPAGYGEAVERAGGLSLIITPDSHLVAHPDDLLQRIDGLILSGGYDVDPDFYGADREPETVETMPDRDEFEIALTRRAVELDMPVLGICRGMQVLNVAFGGTLIQHLPNRFGHQDHRRVPGSFDGADHDVRLSADSVAAAAAGELRHATKSHHHQGVDVVGDGLTATGVSALDDLVEAIELPGHRFVLGVQWHPEADENSSVIPALVNEAAAYQRARLGPGDAVHAVPDRGYRTASGSA